MPKSDEIRSDENDVSQDNCESDCPLQPQFVKNTDSVQLTRDKYVQLLIEARETDPGCWPPGLEDAARLLARACVIEERCTTKHGHFEPENLSKKMRDEYMKIHLALDELQNDLESGATDAEDDSDSADGVEPISAMRGAWSEINSHPRPENFA